MAKKSRTPAPPRQVQAPQPRAASPRSPGEGGRRRLLVIGSIAGVVVIGLVVGLVIALGGGGGGALAAGGCIHNTYPAQGRNHITSDQPFKAGFEYNSFPPTSGPHLPPPGGPAIWNLYSDPIRQISLIHNLEHGGIVVQYGDKVSADTVAQLTAWWQNDPQGIVVAPLPALHDQVAVTAWTQMLSCPGFSEEALDAFRDTYLGKGPERFPVEALKPGVQ